MTEEEQPLEHDAGSALLALLDEMTQTVETARSVPLSSQVIVNQAQMLELFESARQVVPQEIRTADMFLADADAALESGRHESAQMIAEAKTEAERLTDEAEAQAAEIIAQAHAEAHQLVEQDRIVTLATARAEEIIADAQEQARHLQQGANEYSDDRLASIEEVISRITAELQAGRQELADRIALLESEETAGSQD